MCNEGCTRKDNASFSTKHGYLHESEIQRFLKACVVFPATGHQRRHGVSRVSFKDHIHLRDASITKDKQELSAFGDALSNFSS